MIECLIGLGSNLGDRQENVRRAVALLCAAQGVANVDVSSWHTTSPIGGPAGQSPFLNAAARFTSTLDALALLDVLQSIEAQLGRTRNVHWGPRTIDLDLLLYGDEIIDSPRLLVPHPRLAVRTFVLAPACEIAADMRHPQSGWTMRELLDHLLAAPPYFAVTGTSPEVSARIARAAAEATQGRLIAGSPLDIAASPWERLKFLNAAVQRLPRADKTLGERAVISDFWIGEAWRGASESVGAEIFQRDYQFAEQQIVSPKLLAVVDDSGPHAREYFAWVLRFFSGPTLNLPSDAAAATIELVAAIAAMQP
jgi:2-amino-4-hydroxy-6-hydroxymethyldihydropteridine diphosphokinase